MRLTIDTSAQSVTGDITTRKTPLSLFLSKVQGRYLDLGILPPVVRLITPVSANVFHVIIESRPRYQTLMFETQTYTIPLPWHSFVLTLYNPGNTTKIQITDAHVFFHERETTSEFDFNFDFYRIPWLPNVDPYCRICFTEFHQEFDSVQFTDLWYEFNNMLWGTPFNFDYSTGIGAYSDRLKTEDNYPKAWNLFLKEDLSKLTLEEACTKEFKKLRKEEYAHINVPFLHNLPLINPVLSLNDLFKAVQ